MKISRHIILLMALLPFALAGWTHAADTVIYQGKQGAGQGKHIVFLAGDEEYRSEEGVPMLAKILAVRHGLQVHRRVPHQPGQRHD
jgi:hypothetical protein